MLCYYVFDLLQIGGQDLTALLLRDRREKLKNILPAKKLGNGIRFSSALGHDAPRLLKKAQSLGLEGLIGKREGSAYEPGRRTGAWIKLKIVREQEFVIGGYTDPGGARQHFGALLVGVYEKKSLVYAGKVGTGFSEAVLADLARRFKPLARKTCPFVDLPEARKGRYGQGITPAIMKRCHWLKPELVCQVRFSEWTADARLRQPAYLGLREDKDPNRVVREEPANPS
jgi:bifunctional non-homologous end joining protein LigD